MAYIQAYLNLNRLLNNLLFNCEELVSPKQTILKKKKYLRVAPCIWCLLLLGTVALKKKATTEQNIKNRNTTPTNIPKSFALFVVSACTHCRGFGI